MRNNRAILNCISDENITIISVAGTAGLFEGYV